MGIRATLMAAVLGCALMGFAPGEIALSSVEVADVALKQFGPWDSDKDGVLSKDELEAAILNPEVRGANAAAAVALLKFGAQEAKAGNKLKWTREFVNSETIRNRSTTYRLEISDDDAAELDDDEKARDGGGGDKKPKSMPTAQALFDRARRTMAKPLPALFEDENGRATNVPVMSKLRQGPMGDCYLIAVLGAQVNANPKRISEMLVRVPSAGSAADSPMFRVAWGDGTTTEVEALTHGERAMSGAGTAGGMWVRVFEKALLLRKLPEDVAEGTLTQDGVGKGGNPRAISQLITGHKVKGTGFFAGRKNVTAEMVSERIKAARPGLAAAIAAKRLVTMSTPDKAELPPGINKNHAYAVIGFDPSTDMLKVWNPHGNRFQPKRTAGLEAGYVTRGGVFEIKLEEAARIFKGVAWETDEPVTAKDLKQFKGAATKVSGGK